MSLASKNETPTNGSRWQPSATLTALQLRAQVIRRIREFFHQRGILEVETPLLCHTTVSDPYIESIPALLRRQFNGEELTYYLQTSPEYAMKRLLAAGFGPIYQICKAFRQAEIGSQHNPEFTMLEWYRPGYNDHDLMDETSALLQDVLHFETTERISYQELFQHHLAIDPLHCSNDELRQCARKNNLKIADDFTDKDDWLNLLMSHLIEPKLGLHQPIFVYDFPATQAALARLHGEPTVAARFEVYIQGMEIANGFYELSDVVEQRQRFEKNNMLRRQLTLTEIELDELLLAALRHGLPECAGIAVGVDRLIMLAAKTKHISEVISFDISRA